jgi:hypothetical protein
MTLHKPLVFLAMAFAAASSVTASVAQVRHCKVSSHADLGTERNVGSETRSGADQTSERPRPPTRFDLQRSLHRVQRAHRLCPKQDRLDPSRLTRTLKDCTLQRSHGLTNEFLIVTYTAWLISIILGPHAAILCPDQLTSHHRPSQSTYK